MMKLKLLGVFFCLIYSTVTVKAKASLKDSTQLPVRIAIVAPFYLDSAFNGSTYRLGQTRISKYFLTGLEFYNGINMAIDSLKKEGHDFEVSIFDLYKKGQSLQQLTTAMETQSFSLVLGAFNNSTEQKAIADFGLKNQVPVISITYPNDGGIVNNPFFYLLNPTWQTHVAAIGSYVSRHYSGKKILLVTKNGALESKICNLVRKESDSLIGNAQTLLLPDDTNVMDTLSYFLDSTRENVIICGSFNEILAKEMVKSLNEIGDTYACTIVGLPNWNSMGNIKGKYSNNLQIVVSSPFNYSKNQDRMSRISDMYKTKFYARPSDMVYKGYETMYHFTRLLLSDPTNFINAISSSYATVFSEFDFRAVNGTNNSGAPGYFENKKIYFYKYMNGDLREIAIW